ncbi:transcriptional regulator NrdR [Mageeibacillus indolicus]|jgi:hypothetical protein|uniref:Transcriptional repressor NrdR n=2 Tax=Mageeibacillus indolicus TaxID=884684 RepID=D3R0H6_MAGIU|nr:transcriptional regulator NrdR [Mageeibacillus indolicus]ADC90628.1 transcriptional regulator NrdR [Mageeibacillus indolicus UPII9-5]KFA56760.1 NrdR family transcriptional regulator [Mageeibacillus indolicus 0009-5]PNH18790.1 transcriptional regulator NrdR [Mageeibacillus indolicus]
MRCPFCSHDEDRVIDSRPAEDGAAIRRRRECLSCNRRYTTYEKIESTPLLVIKKDGTREPFSREKLTRGLLRSFEKRPVTSEELDQIVSRIEAVPRNKLCKEIRSEEIGELVLQELRQLDEVAYVRFASVYRRFEDVDSFLRELKALRPDDGTKE